jgi:TPR repeat protein
VPPLRFVLLLLLLVVATVYVSWPGPDAAKLLEEMEATKPDWLSDLDTCPADVMPARETMIDYAKGRCAAALDRCLRNCRGGDASECYSAALVLEEVRDGPVSDALFLKACALGFVSGCTNRAARMEDGGRGASCAIRTFDMACERDDPWACTMIGFHLIRGMGVVKDHARARQVLAKSCRFGEDDPACTYARRLMRQIDD